MQMAGAVMGQDLRRSPSSPSTKFMALTIDTVSANVTRIDDIWSGTMVPTPPEGDIDDTPTRRPW